MGKLSRLETICVAIEAAYNTVNAPNTATDGVCVRNLSFAFADVRRAERPNNKPSFGKQKAIPAGELMELSFEVEMKGSGVVGTPPEFDKLLRICAMSVNTASNVVYSPIEIDQESATIDYWVDGGRLRLSGCRGNFSLSANVGEIGVLSFTIKGHFVEHVDSAYPTNLSYLGTDPESILGVSANLGGYSPEVTAFGMEFGNVVATPSSATSPDGYGEIIITDRDPTITIDPELPDVATKDLIAEFLASTGQAFSYAWGTTAGNRFALNFPEIYPTDLSPGDRDGIRTLDQTYGCSGSPPVQLIVL